LVDRKNKRAFTGDTISMSPVYLFGPGRCLEAYIESLRKLDEKTDGIDFFYVCHGETKVPRGQLKVQIRGAERLLVGELNAEDPPEDLPCKLYRFESCSFLY
jgi:glyoxylase-like metal-dependent hydrolase (beta-lactamase superfamily II)